MLSLDFDGFDPSATLVVIRPINSNGVLLVVNVVGENGCKPAISNLAIKEHVSMLTRRFGKLMAVCTNLQGLIKGSEIIVDGDATHFRYGHILYRKRSLAEIKGRTGTFNLMTPCVNVG